MTVSSRPLERLKVLELMLKLLDKTQVIPSIYILHIYGSEICKINHCRT